MTAMVALERARQAWEHSQPQLQLWYGPVSEAGLLTGARLPDQPLRAEPEAGAASGGEQGQRPFASPHANQRAGEPDEHAPPSARGHDRTAAKHALPHPDNHP